VGVGAGVAINIADINNEAYLGGGGTITAANININALMAEKNSENTLVDTISSEAVSGANGGTVGIAGALAMGVLDVTNRAEIRSGSHVIITGGGAVSYIS
jgi:hypothetical protein